MKLTSKLKRLFAKAKTEPYTPCAVKEDEPVMVGCPGNTILQLYPYSKETHLGILQHLASNLDISVEKADALILGKIPVTEFMAEKLEEMSAVPKFWWMNAEARYQKYKLQAGK